MKVSQKQAELLAKEIVAKIKATNSYKAPDEIVKSINQFCSKRQKLVEKKAAVQEEINVHDLHLKKIVGTIGNISAYDDAKKMIEKYENKSIPSLQEVEDEIILQSMFADEKDMKAFIDKISASYEKKLKRRALTN